MEKLTVDRTEEGIAVIEKEDGTFIKKALSEFSFPVKEGDVLLFDGEKYVLSEEEKTQRVNKLLLMQEKLKKKSENK